ncbi:DUF11 domain-containing protein [Methanobacterium aggregans]|uniref:DUF11 domain-containing protein n=1 Tax=Methanobacterium aggregans TaxID=1615586 RepID=UPI001AE50B53|nr:DUF11 domain-containing protein [Methanobacterium aggregans]MBP2044964.1 putative repeat protein (TIGR01451 family) [Methanobacterium aggregans]
METKNKHSVLKIPLLLLMCVVMLSLGVNAVSAAGASDNSTIYVSTQGNDTWDGLNATYNGTSGPKKTITNATGTVATNGTVHIAKGTYNESGININHNMTITGENQQNTIINGTNTDTIFYIISGVNVNISNLTLTQGESPDGGAIYNEGITTLTNCNFENNSVYGYGGAIENYGALNITKCVFTNNSAMVDGGAISNEKGCSVNIKDSTLTGNTAMNNGGAIYNGGTLTITNTALTNNNASRGGAIINIGNLNVTNSTLANNNATNYGGALFNFVRGETTPRIVNFNRIVGNNASYGSAIYCLYGAVDATLNWWGSNDPVWTNLILNNAGTIDTSTWLYMTINATPTTINNTQSSLVTVSFNNQYNGTTVTSFDPKTGHIPDGTFVNSSSALGTFSPITTTINGIATSVFTASHAGTGNLNATTDNQTVTQLLTVNPASYLYLNTTTSKKNPTTGETFIVTYKLSNSGPDNATNVTVSFQIPAGLEFVTATVDNGTYNYNAANRTVTWNLTNVAVGDPYLYLTVKALGTGSYSITPTITSETFNRNTNPLMPFSISVKAQNNSNGNTVNAATTTKTVPMQTTGMPIAGLVLAILAVLGGIFTPRKK